jgi:hypothetical protein
MAHHFVPFDGRLFCQQCGKYSDAINGERCAFSSPPKNSESPKNPVVAIENNNGSGIICVILFLFSNHLSECMHMHPRILPPAMHSRPYLHKYHLFSFLLYDVSCMQ